MKTRIALIAISMTCFAMCSGLSQTLTRQRQQGDVAPASSLASGSPMMVFTTVVLGGFRGIIADLLWLRATGLQDQGRYVELVQLSDWITKFEPRATQAWAYHAWNMAYNVSIMMPSNEEKWRWVNNGIALLRDQGVSYNAGDPDIYFELAMLYQHKIGRDTDLAHDFYKRALAHDIQSILGPKGSIEHASALAKAELLARHRLAWDYMRTLEARYGNLDWRLPESLALYWAQRGIDVAPGQLHRRCNQIVLSALAQTFFAGELESDPQGLSFVRRPRLDMLEPTILAYQNMMRDYDLSPMNEALRAFVERAIPVLEEYGETRRAAEMRAVLLMMPPPE